MFDANMPPKLVIKMYLPSAADWFIPKRTRRFRHIGMVFQQPNPFAISVFRKVALGLRLSRYKGEVESRIEEAPRSAELRDQVKDSLKSSGLSLSGGRRLRVSAAALIVCFLLGAPMKSTASAQSNGSVNTGVLTCEVAGGFGYVIGSTRQMQCSYAPTSGATEDYHGSMSTIGADIGYLASSAIVWAVVAPSSTSRSGALAGIYSGVSARAAIIGGTGVNALIGGFQNSIALQPLSIEGDTGLYVGAGIGIMNLKAGAVEY